jgi:peptide methionine sulfoxide reductase msrA/msrB
MNKKVNMKNILIVLGIILGIAVLLQDRGFLKKKPTEIKEKQEIMDNKNAREIYFAGGCFWGTEHFFSRFVE